MKKLILLRGVMGSGKSQFIKDNNLEMYTLSTDKIRLMLSSLTLESDYTEKISQVQNTKVWRLLFEILEERMRKGEFTIIDAMHVNKSDISAYDDLIKKYRYRAYIVDFTDISLDELLKRNKKRDEYKKVDEEIIKKKFNQIKKSDIPKKFKVIKPSEFKNMFLTNKPLDYSNYSKVHIIGDIHGSFDTLKKALTDIKEDELYIFLGDYFEKGTQNVEMLNYLSKLADNENMIFLMGNHENKLQNYLNGSKVTIDYTFKKMLDEFQEAGIKDKDIKRFLNRLSQICYFKYDNKIFLASHAGLPFIPKRSFDLISTNEFLYGNCDNIDDLYDKFMQKSKDKIISIHGHINKNKIKPTYYEYSYNLDGDIEHGGNLIVLDITHDGIKVNYYKNDTYDKNLDERVEIYKAVEDMRKSKYIIEKDLGNNLSSFNFSREAFQKRIWNNMTTKARGLFIDTDSYKIVARSYDKFFKVDEREETKLDNLNFAYPITGYLKYNGFLGILSIYDDKLLFATKSRTDGIYKDYFENIFYSLYDEKQVKYIENYLKENDVTMVFEVIDHINDKHIIKYEKDDLVLLDVIYNKLEFEKLEYDKLLKLADKNKMHVKKRVFTINNKREFDELYSKITSQNYKYDDEYVEGFVFEDENGFMVKAKTYYYNYYKRLRTIMENSIENNNYKNSYGDEEIDRFMKYIESKYKDKNVDIKNVNVIDERDAYNKDN